MDKYINQSQAAKMLGITKCQVRNKLKNKHHQEQQPNYPQKQRPQPMRPELLHVVHNRPPLHPPQSCSSSKIAIIYQQVLQ